MARNRGTGATKPVESMAVLYTELAQNFLTRIELIANRLSAMQPPDQIPFRSRNPERMEA
jgi:hypothetical protein